MTDSQPEFTLEPLGRFEWERLVRRALIKPPSIKMLALVMATYANSDGTRVRPGQKRLANVMGTSISTVERGQRALEGLGFIEMTYKGHSAGRGRAGGYASEYRLTIPSDILERIQMLDPDESHPAPMTGDSRIHPASMTGEYAEIPVNQEESPVTGAETPVNSEESPVTHDGPPDHYHHSKDQNNKHQSGSVALSDARVRESHKPDDQKMPREFPESVSIQDERNRQSEELLRRQAEYEAYIRRTA